MKKNCPPLCAVCALMTLLACPSSAQDWLTYQPLHPDSTSIALRLSTVTSSNRLAPFWIRANQFGTVSSAAPAAGLGLKLEHFHWQPDSKGLSWGLGGEMVANISAKSQILAPQLCKGKLQELVFFCRPQKAMDRPGRLGSWDRLLLLVDQRYADTQNTNRHQAVYVCTFH